MRRILAIALFAPRRCHRTAGDGARGRTHQRARHPARGVGSRALLRRRGLRRPAPAAAEGRDPRWRGAAARRWRLLQPDVDGPRLHALALRPRQRLRRRHCVGHHDLLHRRDRRVAAGRRGDGAVRPPVVGPLGRPGTERGADRSARGSGDPDGDGDRVVLAVGVALGGAGCAARTARRCQPPPARGVRTTRSRAGCWWRPRQPSAPRRTSGTASTPTRRTAGATPRGPAAGSAGRTSPRC